MKLPVEDKKHAAHKALVARILEGDARASHAQRHAAFDNDNAAFAEPLRGLINKTSRYPTQIADENVAVVKASGLSEDQIFELVVCAAVGQATRQYETALEALAEAISNRETSKYAS
jgi:hypothetical protein